MTIALQSYHISVGIIRTHTYWELHTVKIVILNHSIAASDEYMLSLDHSAWKETEFDIDESIEWCEFKSIINKYLDYMCVKYNNNCVVNLTLCLV